MGRDARRSRTILGTTSTGHVLIDSYVLINSGDAVLQPENRRAAPKNRVNYKAENPNRRVFACFCTRF